MILKYSKIYLIIALMALTTALKAQNLLVGAGIGGGTFEMNSIKDYNQTIVKLLLFKPVLTDNFPPYFFYKAEVLYCFPKILAIGLNFHTTSTGSRLALSDYSGSFEHDNVQKGLFPGVKIMLGKAPGKSNGLNLLLEGGAAFSTMDVERVFKLADESQTDQIDYNAQGFFVQPGICYFRNIYSNIKLCANVSYYYGFEKGYHLPNEKDQKLFNSESGKPIKPQWDGIRFGITAYWSFRNNAK